MYKKKKKRQIRAYSDHEKRTTHLQYSGLVYPLIIDICVRISGAWREGDDVLSEGYHAMPWHHRRSWQRQRLRLHRLRPNRPLRAYLRHIRL